MDYGDQGSGLIQCVVSDNTESLKVVDCKNRIEKLRYDSYICTLCALCAYPGQREKVIHFALLFPFMSNSNEYIRIFQVMKGLCRNNTIDSIRSER